MTFGNTQNRLRTLGRNTSYLLTGLVVIVLGTYSAIPAFAVSYDADYYYNCGQYNWGIKTAYTYSGSTSLFGHKTNCSAQAGAIPGTYSNGSPDTRTNYVELESVLDSAQLPYQAWESSIQGCDPFGNCDTTGGATVGTRYSIPGSDTNLALQTQFVWLQNSTNVPNYSGSYANLLTDFWLKPTSGSSDLLVLDFASANLGYSSGNWALKSETVGGHYSGNVVTGTSPNCTYHYNVVIDNNSAPNTWRQTNLYTSISANVTGAAAATYTQSNGSNCATTLPSTENLNSDWDVVDIESGVEVGDSNSDSGVLGTETGAYSQTYVTY